MAIIGGLFDHTLQGLTVYISPICWILKVIWQLLKESTREEKSVSIWTIQCLSGLDTFSPITFFKKCEKNILLHHIIKEKLYFKTLYPFYFYQTAVETRRGAGPIDIRPSNNYLQQFVKTKNLIKKKKYVTPDMRHVTFDTWHVTRDMWHLIHDIWQVICRGR